MLNLTKCLSIFLNYLVYFSGHGELAIGGSQLMYG